MIDVNRIHDIDTLVHIAKWLEGRTLREISEAISQSDEESRVTTKGSVGYIVEKGFFNIEANSGARPDIEHLGVEIKTNPLKYSSDRTLLTVKEPLSLNIINYSEELKCNDITDSSLYKKNKKILFVFYLHDFDKPRSEYTIQYVQLWEMDDLVLSELRPDYNLIQMKIRQGRAHQIHQTDHQLLTLCPKHNGKFHDPNCTRSKTKQPLSDEPAEIRAFRLKNSYMKRIICRALGVEEQRGGWEYGEIKRNVGSELPREFDRFKQT